MLYFVLMILGILVAAPLSIVVIMDLIFFTDYEERVYDTPADRLKRIRGDMIQSIKDPNMDRKTRATLTKDILLMDDLIGKARDFQSFFNVLWKYMSSKRRKAYNDRILQQELETVINNPLFVRTAQLRELA